MITKEDLKNDIFKVNRLLSKVPTIAEYNAYGDYSSQSVKRIFDATWNSVMQSLLGGVNMSHGKPRLKKPCKNCGEGTKNTKFCSKKCASSFNNRLENGRKTGQRAISRSCEVCGGEIIRNRNKRCPNCQNLIKSQDGKLIPIESATKFNVLTNDTQRYRRIRGMAQGVAKQNMLLEKCFKCSYSKCVECCHRKAISSFPDNTKLTVINDPSNLIGLCPNHHWEFDNGFYNPLLD